MSKVFIVEDDPSIQFLYSEYLNINGFDIAGIANDGEEAVTMFKSFSEKPMVIIMDHRMPNKNGLEALKEIIQIEPRIKVIFASADDRIKEYVLSLGAFDFKKKPFDMNSLMDTVKIAINSICRLALA